MNKKQRCKFSGEENVAIRMSFPIFVILSLEKGFVDNGAVAFEKGVI